MATRLRPAAIFRALTPRGRFGLRIMAERAAELGGEVKVQRRRRGGLRIEARIPDTRARVPARSAVPVPAPRPGSPSGAAPGGPA